MDAARAADAALDTLNARWDGPLAGGKWRHIMAEEPADGQWTSLRLTKWTPALAAQAAAGPRPPSAPAPLLVREAAAYTGQQPGKAARWVVIPGLGHGAEGALAPLPSSAPPTDPARVATDAARLDYAIELDAPGRYRLDLRLLPTHPLAGDALRLAVGLDGTAPRIVALPVKIDSPAWAQGVLDAQRTLGTTLDVDAPGRHTLHVYAVDAGVVLDSLALTRE
jgi:hypothetical protein